MTQRLSIFEPDYGPLRMMSGMEAHLDQWFPKICDASNDMTFSSSVTAY